MKALLASVGMILALSSIVSVGQESAWAIIATVSLPDHEPVPYQAKIFFSEAECETFLASPDMDEAVASLTEYERVSHDDKTLTVTVECAVVGHR